MSQRFAWRRAICLATPCASALLAPLACAPAAPPATGDRSECPPVAAPAAAPATAPAPPAVAPATAPAPLAPVEVVAPATDATAAPAEEPTGAVDPSEPSASGEPVPPPVGPFADYPDILEFREPGASARCGDFVVGPLVNMPLKMGVAVTRTDGRLVAQYVPRFGIDAFFPAYCGDLTGDGSTVLVVRYSTGGAHCCHTELVVRLGEPPESLGSFDMDDGGYATPAKLRPGKAYQLVMDDRILVSTSAPFSCFAATPGLPMILDYDGRRYSVQTKRFPDRIRRARAAQLAEMGTCDPGDTACDEARGAYLAATGYLLGDWASARRSLSSAARTAGERVIGELKQAGR